jgi:hypothetical protein
MAATTTTRELFPKATIQRSQVEAQQALEIKAGAIRSSITDDGTNWVLVTEWNVLGQND